MQELFTAYVPAVSLCMCAGDGAVLRGRALRQDRRARALHVRCSPDPDASLALSSGRVLYICVRMRAALCLRCCHGVRNEGTATPLHHAEHAEYLQGEGCGGAGADHSERGGALPSAGRCAQVRCAAMSASPCGGLGAQMASVILCKHAPVARRCWGMASLAVCAASLLCGGKGCGIGAVPGGR